MEQNWFDTQATLQSSSVGMEYAGQRNKTENIEENE